MASKSTATASREAVPTTIGSWVGKPVPLERKVYDILETADVAALEYTRGTEEPIWFAQVAGFGNRAAFHPPELCFVGSHFEVLERGPVTVMVQGRPHHLMRLVIGQEGRRYEAWYWFTANGRVTPNYYQQQWWLVMDSLKGRAASGTLMRLSTPIDSPEASHRRLMSFLTSWESAQSAEASDATP